MGFQWLAISKSLTLYELRNPASCTYLSLGGSFYNPFDKRSTVENVWTHLDLKSPWVNFFDFLSYDPSFCQQKTGETHIISSQLCKVLFLIFLCVAPRAGLFPGFSARAFSLFDSHGCSCAGSRSWSSANKISSSPSISVRSNPWCASVGHIPKMLPSWGLHRQ